MAEHSDHSPKPAVLVVDDDSRALLGMEDQLQSDGGGYDIVTASSGAEALCRLLEPREFALVLLDVRMPLMDGFAVAHAMKAEQRLARLPICFLTASLGERADVVHAYTSGAVDVLLKPVDPALLRAKVAVFIDLWQKTRELAVVNSQLMKEISERKKNEARVQLEQDRLSQIFASISDGVMFIDTDHKIASANQRCSEMFDLELTEVCGLMLHELLLTQDCQGTLATRSI